MQENEFEDRVQKIMDELSFDPHDTVWSGVAKEIEKDKKRRKPLFWIFLLGAPVIIGAGYLFSTGNFSAGRPPLHLHGQEDSLHTNIATGKISRISDTSDAAAKHPVLVINQKLTARVATGGSYRSGLKSRKVRAENDFGNQFTEKPMKENGKTAVLLSPETRSPENNTGSEKINAENVDAAAAAGVTAGTKKISADTMAQANNPVPVSAKSPDSAASSGKTAAKKKDKSPWTFGFTGTAGASGISQPFGNQGYTLYGPSNSPAGGGGAIASPVQPPNPALGFSFSAGAFVQRALSGRISISGGLNYHYFSAKTTVGNLVSNSGSTYNGSLTYFSGAYYTNTGSHSHTDEFHFLELPVLVDFTLNKNKKTPLIWEAGFSFAYLLSSDYLYFDPYAKVYYKNDGVLNKDQWNLSTALMIGWNINQGRFLLGPQVQYGISGLLNSSQAYSQYLYSFGLKFSFIPGGK